MECGEKFLGSSALHDHISVAHEKKKPRKCKNCGILSKLNSSHTCKNCHEILNIKEVSQTINLKKENSNCKKLSHIHDKGEKCPICYKGKFEKPELLTKHSKNKHSNDEQKPEKSCQKSKGIVIIGYLDSFIHLDIVLVIFSN